MFWSNQSEIKKVKKAYGEKKGTEFLTYFNTYIQETAPLIKQGDTDEAKQFAKTIVNKIIQEHGVEYNNEFQKFLVDSLNNDKLILQLSKAGDKYVLEETLQARRSIDVLMKLFK